MKHVKQWTSMLLVLAMLIPNILIPDSFAAVQSGEGNAVAGIDTAEGIAFETQEIVLPEGGGTATIGLTRTGDVSKGASVTVTAYDISADYATDYQLLQDGKEVKAENEVTSLYNAFRDNGFTTDRTSVDLAMVAGLAEMQQTGKTAEEMIAEVSGEQIDADAEKTQDMSRDDEENDQVSQIDILNEIGAKAAEITITFKPGQKTGSLEVKALEDENSEYNESFLLMLSSEDSTIGSENLLIATIEDNEADAPNNTVSFADDTATVNAEIGVADVWLNRTGAIETFATVLLCQNGEPHGYVSFNPYQEQQMVQVPAGTYQLANPNGCGIAGTAEVVVTDAVAEGEKSDSEEQEQDDEQQAAIALASEHSTNASAIDEKESDSEGEQTEVPAELQAETEQKTGGKTQPQQKAVPAPRTEQEENFADMEDLPAVISSIGERGLPMPDDNIPTEVEPELDTVPEYDALPNEEESDGNLKLIPDWASDWTKHGNYEDESAIVYAPQMQFGDYDPLTSWIPGPVKNALFEMGGKSGEGDFFLSVPDNNYELTTSGTGSHMKTSHIYADSQDNYDMTGIGAVTINYHVEGLEKGAEVHVGVSGTTRNSVEVRGGNGNITGELSCTLPSKSQVNKYIYAENVDPTNGDDGCEVYLMNAIKLEKRQYYIAVETPAALQYTDGSYAATIDGNNSRMYKTVWDDISSDTKNNSHINIVYNDSGHPQTLVGYKLKNGSTMKESDVIPLQDGVQHIVFDRNFLKSYENDYCYTSKENGSSTSYETFCIIPVMEKIPLESYSLEKSSLGTIKLTNADANGKLYKGDQAIFESENSAEGVSLEGVYVKARQSGNNEWKTWTVYADSDNKVRVSLNDKYDDYMFQGVYSTDADVLTVTYAEGAQTRGTLAFPEGQAVTKAEYVKNEYFPLMAKANDGYVTKWMSNGREYYGDVFYYQLDGNSDNNSFTVDFVKENTKTETINGALSVTDANLRNSALSTSHPLEYTEYSVTSSENYTGRTDEEGTYTIENFTGVEGGTYSMAVLYGDLYCYRTFTFGDKSTYSGNIPQFGPGIFFPDEVKVTLDGTGVSDNKIQLRTGGVVQATVAVFNQINSPYDVGSVELKLYGIDENTNQITYPVQTVTASRDDSLTELSGGGNYTYYVATVLADELPQDTRLYVEAVGTTEIENAGTVEIRSGEVNAGYEFITPIKDTSLPVQEDVPITPGAQNALDVNLSDLDIPIIGSLDMGVNARNGAFFVRQPDVNDPSIYYLVAGYSVTPVWGTGLPHEKIKAADETKKALEEAENSKKEKGDTSDVKSDITSEPDESQPTKEGEEKKPDEKKNGRNKIFCIYPAMMIKFGVQAYTNEAGENVNELSSFEMVVGFDERFMANFPVTIYGIPFYLNLSFAGEQYLQVQTTFETGAPTSIGLEDDKHDIQYDADSIADSNLAFQLPMTKIGLKGGIGYNALIGAYLEGTVNFKLNVEFVPDINAGGALACTIGFGADVIVFSGTLTFEIPEADFGNDKLREEIVPVSSNMSLSAKNDSYEGDNVQQMESMDTQSMEQAFAKATFSPVERQKQGLLFRSGSVDSTVLMENAFKGTQVKLTELGNNKIMATMLADNGAENNNLNFLSAAYAISEDNGKTWKAVEKISESSNLQFDTNVYELNDRLLVTWSEGDMNAVVAGKDVNALTATDMAQAANAMNLKGRYFNKETGEPEGESFTIAANTSVACAALDAVEDEDGNVYVYYQRNQYPTGENVSVEHLIQQERTIACAVGTMDGKWESHAVTATNDDGTKQYRIMEVVPFSHDGIVGEAVVIDRNGKLAVENESTRELDADNYDRQIFIRFYSNTGSGEPKTTALIPITDADACAQNVEVVSNDDYLYLFWNQNGKLVYLSDFAVTSDEAATNKAQAAIAVVNTETGEVTQPKHQEGIGCCVAANHSSLKVEHEYSVSMSDNGDVLLSWISEEQPETEEDIKTFQTDEIYGVMLQTEEKNSLNELVAVGDPVALTDEDSVLNKVDSVCLSSDSFLLAFSQLDDETWMQSEKADIRAVQSTYEPKLKISSVDAPEYPLPGSEMTVDVTVCNDGLEPLQGVQVTASGVGDGATETYSENILPGQNEQISLTVPIPEDFNRTTTLEITASGLNEQSEYAATGKTEIQYGAYFVPEEMAKLYSIPNTNNYLAELNVRNIGNAPGEPEVTYVNYLPGSDDESSSREDVFKSEKTIEPNATVRIPSIIKNTLATTDNKIRVQVSLGDSYDQNAESYAPTPIVTRQREVQYPVKLADTKHGSVTSNVKQAKGGETVTLTVIPDNGYELKQISVVDAEGNVVKLSGGNKTYTFAMPENSVTVSATFRKISYNPPSVDPNPPSPASKHPFVDVTDDSWYAEVVQYVYENSMMVGIDETHFAPNAILTRAELAQILYNKAGQPEVSSLSTFADVPATAWYAKAIAWAQQNDVVSGIGNNQFAPNQTITREQIAVMLYNEAGKPEVSGTITGFADVKDVSDWAYNAVLWATQNEVLNGALQSDDTIRINPTNSATRAETAALLKNFLEAK